MSDRLADLPEVFVSSAEITTQVSRAVARGEIRKLAPRLYTTNLEEEPAAIVRRNLWQVVGLLFPDTVVSHRTALDPRPSPGGTVFITGAYDRTVELPGVRVRQLRGPGPLEGDLRFVQSLRLASQARAFLECLSFERVREGSPALPRPDIEDRLSRVVQLRGEEAVNEIRDRARSIAGELDASDALERLDGIIGALLHTRDEHLSGAAARARAGGEPYDPTRLELLTQLHAHLFAKPAPAREENALESPSWENISFIDAYFSNFIEGTEFSIDEAAAIVFENRIPATRPQDAHDILGTYRLVASRQEMKTVASQLGPEEFIGRLRRHHHTILQARPEVRPGQFKLEPNRAGLTVFVEPELVRGTLKRGFELYRSLPDAFHRAVFMMFLVAEVHPFADGNGRVARAEMNAELIAGGERRIFIPISYRDDYLLALRALSRRSDPEPLVRMLDRAQRYAASIDFSDLDRALATLERTHAFEQGGRLSMPTTDA